MLYGSAQSERPAVHAERLIDKIARLRLECFPASETHPKNQACFTGWFSPRSHAPRSFPGQSPLWRSR